MEVPVRETQVISLSGGLCVTYGGCGIPRFRLKVHVILNEPTVVTRDAPRRQSLRNTVRVPDFVVPTTGTKNCFLSATTGVVWLSLGLLFFQKIKI